MRVSAATWLIGACLITGKSTGALAPVSGWLTEEDCFACYRARLTASQGATGFSAADGGSQRMSHQKRMTGMLSVFQSNLAAKLSFAALVCLAITGLMAQAPPASDPLVPEETDAAGFKYQKPTESLRKSASAANQIRFNV